MTTLELSLHHNYCPSWGVWEGIRELVQNALDAQDEGSPLEARYVKASGTVKIISRKARLSRETLLIGQTTKADREDLRGQFGEGLKIGLLALVRQGLRVTVRTGDEMWLPKIEASKRYNAEVLKVKIRTCPQTSPDVIIAVGGLAESAWDELRELVLPLCPRSSRPKNTVKTSGGALILDPDYMGKLYVKGLYVCTSNRLRYGYDLNRLKLDRDRKLADRDDLAWETARVWGEALGRDPDLVAHCSALLDDDEASDLENAPWTSSLSADVIAEAWKAKHGEKAVPVKDLAQSKELGHLGREGVIVGSRMARVLEKSLGSYEEQVEKAKESASRTVGWSELTTEEQENLEATIVMVARVTDKASLANLTVREYADEELLGRHFDDGRIELSRKVLADRTRALAIYCHELAHELGTDGDAKFHHGVEGLLAAVAIHNLIGGAK